MHHVRQCLDLAGSEIRLVAERELAGLGHHEMTLNTQHPEFFEHADAVRRATRASDANYQPRPVDGHGPTRVSGEMRMFTAVTSL